MPSSFRDLILALDTGSPVASVALVGARGRPRISRVSDARNHGPTLVRSLQELLQQAEVELGSLGAVACGRGPGSFTGLRIGLATAKGLCFALGIPLLLPSSLEALARAAFVTAPCVVAVCTDARRRELFCAAWAAQPAVPDTPATPTDFAVLDALATSTDFAAPQAPAAAGAPAGATPALRPLLPPFAATATEVAHRLRALEGPGPMVLVGNGVSLYRERLEAGLPANASLPDPAPRTPDAAHLADLAREAWARGEVADLVSAEPEYLRPSDAELNRHRRRAAEERAGGSARGSATPPPSAEPRSDSGTDVERALNERGTGSERDLNGPGTDPEQTRNRPGTDPERTRNGPGTDSEGTGQHSPP